MKMMSIALATMFSVFCAQAALAEGDDWAGLYQAIDPVDGSVNYLSIVPLGDGLYELHVTVSHHGRCEAPAVIVATGRLADDNLHREQATLHCRGADSPVEHGDSAYSLDHDNRIITHTASMDGRRMHFHRIGDD
ncbi:MAG: hypothetical protein AAF414_11635 [Pseudomonadota bacterium]